MLRTTLAFAAAIFAASAGAQAQTGSFQEMPTTVVPLPNPALQPPQGNVTIIQGLPPGLANGGVITGPGPLPGMGSGGFVTLGAPPAPPTWASSPGQAYISTRGPNDKYEGRWICRANYNGIWFVGHRQQAYGKDMCVFALGDKVQRTDVAQMLWQFPNVPVRWMSLQGNQMPQGIFVSDTTGRGLPLCRTLVQNVLNIGWADKNGCHVPRGERGEYTAVTMKNYEIIALGEIKPKPPGQPSGPNINLGGVFDVDATNPTPNKR